MRFGVIDRGISYRRHEYVLDFHEKFSERKFVDGLNMALGGVPEFEDYSVVKRKSRYYLTNNSSKQSKQTKKLYAELAFSQFSNNQQVIFTVRRLAIKRERLSEILETLICGQKFNQHQQESQPCQNEQLDLSLPG